MGKKSQTMEKPDMVYIVESLLEKEGSMYLVKWKSYTNWWNSWEPREGLPQFIVKVSDRCNLKLYLYWIIGYPYFRKVTPKTDELLFLLLHQP